MAGAVARDEIQDAKVGAVGAWFRIAGMAVPLVAFGIVAQTHQSGDELVLGLGLAFGIGLYQTGKRLSRHSFIARIVATAVAALVAFACVAILANASADDDLRVLVLIFGSFGLWKLAVAFGLWTPATQRVFAKDYRESVKARPPAKAAFARSAWFYVPAAAIVLTTLVFAVPTLVGLLLSRRS